MQSGLCDIAIITRGKITISDDSQSWRIDGDVYFLYELYAPGLSCLLIHDENVSARDLPLVVFRITSLLELDLQNTVPGLKSTVDVFPRICLHIVIAQEAFQDFTG